MAFLFGGEAVPDACAGEGMNAVRSIECQIMDWADDTAYSVNDLIDGIRAGFLTPARIRDWAEDTPLDAFGSQAVDFILATIDCGDLELTFSGQIGECIRACRLRPHRNSMSDRTHRHAFELAVEEPVRRRADWFRRLAAEVVFRSARLHQLEAKGGRLLRRVFACYRDAYLDGGGQDLVLLPPHRDRAVRREPDPARRARLLCDYIAGMTDGFAVRTYKRLFDPEFGSIVDIV